MSSFSSPEYLIARARRQERTGRKGDISQFYGKIPFPEDGLAYQQRIQAEWDR
jgi:hypothetical protein